MEQDQLVCISQMRQKFDKFSASKEAGQMERSFHN